jgi:cell division transport system permease protein
MTRFNHILRELGRNLIRNPGTALGSLLSLTLLFLLFNLFWVAATSSDRFYDDLLSDLRMEVFVNEAYPDSLIPQLETELQGFASIDTFTFVSRQMAREELASRLGIDLLVGYDTLNPLPRSFILTLHRPALNSEFMAGLEEQLSTIEGVGSVTYSRNFLLKAESTRDLILRVGVVLGGLILLTALISSANNIRLMTRSRARGLRQMMLMGAGRLFVGLPFLIEGLVIAGLAAVASWAIVIYGQQQIQFTQLTIVLPTYDYIGAYCVTAAVVGGISGYLGIRMSLKRS